MNSKDIIALVHSTKDLICDETLAHEISVKGAADFVTRVDTAVQNDLKEKLEDLTPDFLFLAEEQENQKPDPGQSCWILDPIDGTTNLIHDYRLCAVSLALWEHGRVSFGVVYNPFMEETYHAEAGKGAFLNGNPIHVSHRKKMENCVIAFGSSPYEKQLAPRLFPVFQKIFESSADFRRSGSAALDLCHVAAGRIDGYLEWNLKPWDFSAGQLIAREAGATVSKWDGSDLYVLQNSDILAATPEIHGQLLSFLNTF